MSYRVMIIDDEPLILAGIASMLEWEKHGCAIVGKASNGQQALCELDNLRPDIVITDIKMPAMDGIAFMKEVRKKNQDTAFVVLTNLEEFSMAREALDLGASAYLVKLELTEDALLESISRAKQYCDSRGNRAGAGGGREVPVSMEELTRSYFLRLMVGDVDEMKEEEIPERLAERFMEPVIVLIQFNDPFSGFTPDFTREDQKKNMSFAENIITEMVKGFFDESCVVRREQNGFLLALSAAGAKDYKETIRALAEKLISVIKDYFEVTVSVSVSEKGEGLQEFSDLLYQSMYAMNSYYYDTSRQILFYSGESENGKGHSDQFNISFMKGELGQFIRINDSQRFRKTTGDLIALLREARPAKLQAVNACCNLYYYVSSFFEDGESDFPFSVNIMEELNRLNSLDDIIGWISWFQGKVEVVLSSGKHTRSDKIMLLVQEYVTEHYREKLTLTQVAEKLNLSPGHLSSSFKKQYGNSFSEYVSEIKIKKAKELIAAHKYLMYEISDMLGFDTQYYFSTVFKKVTGCSPKEYEMEILMQQPQKL